MTDPAAALDRTVALLQSDLFPGLAASAIVEALTATQVRVHADGDVLASAAGRTALVATSTAVARLGAGIELSIPNNVPNDGLPPLTRDEISLRAALELHASKLITPPRAATPDLTISLGQAIDSKTICIGGNGFACRLEIGRSAGGWSGSAPFGGGLAASAAAAEVARHALARLAHGHRVARFYADKLEPRPCGLSLPPLNADEPLHLGHVDLISAGAISHAALLMLIRRPGIAVDFRVFDDDIADVTNLNRYLLLDADGIGILKTKLLERLGSPDFRIRGVESRLGTAGVTGGLADRVLVGVDNVEGRHIVQRIAPNWIGIGATSHLEAVVSEHVPGTACAGCRHPVDEPLQARLPTISFVSLLAGALLAYALLRRSTQRRLEPRQFQVLDALNLANTSFLTNPVRPIAACPLKCVASQALRR